jgi:hypothetical protein
MESILEREVDLEATFEDGPKVVGDMLLDCDGIYSSICMNFIEPERKPIYTGIAVTYGFLDAVGISYQPQFDLTAAIFGRFATFLCSYYTANSPQLYVSVVTKTKDVGIREGWTVKGSGQNAIKKDIIRRFSGPSMPYLEAGMEKVKSWVLYPVFKLPPDGTWHAGRLLLLGDVVHTVGLLSSP